MKLVRINFQDGRFSSVWLLEPGDPECEYIPAPDLAAEGIVAGATAVRPGDIFEIPEVPKYARSARLMINGIELPIEGRGMVITHGGEVRRIKTSDTPGGPGDILFEKDP